MKMSHTLIHGLGGSLCSKGKVKINSSFLSLSLLLSVFLSVSSLYLSCSLSLSLSLSFSALCEKQESPKIFIKCRIPSRYV